MKKNIIITGASEGIGAEIAKILNNGNDNIFLIDKRELKEIKESKNIFFYLCDVSIKEDFKRIISEIIEKYGEIDAIINNAGEMNLANLEEQKDNLIERMINSNILGVINGTQLVIDSMKRNKKGTIINIASTAGRYAYVNHAVYCGTKHAVRGFTKTMRQELAQYNIRVSIVSPGAVYTDLAKNGETENKYLKPYLEWRDKDRAYVTSKDIANVTKFVLEQPQDVIIWDVVVTSIRQIR
ncbi:MAG: oxidoreductase [Candidatus Hepatoplasma vulgare]|nr:MAG: oxidoreductase [Candidatus Hepatoplasma sp.]